MALEPRTASWRHLEPSEVLEFCPLGRRFPELYELLLCAQVDEMAGAGAATLQLCIGLLG